MHHNSILGTVLAGGKSQRFGEDKSQVELDGKLLIDHILNEIISEFKEILIVSNNHINFKHSDNISITSDLKKNQGPLGGVLSAMKWAKQRKREYKWISTFPVDTPFFKKEILQSFLREINLQESKLFFIKSNNTQHNIFGIWSIDLMEKLEEDLNNGKRKVEQWANDIGVKVIEMKFLNEDPFFNINSKKDLEKAKKIKNDQLS